MLGIVEARAVRFKTPSRADCGSACAATICTCIRTHIYVYIYIYMYTHKKHAQIKYVHIGICIYIYIYTYACVCVYTYTGKHTYIAIYIYIYMQIDIYIYIVHIPRAMCKNTAIKRVPTLYVWRYLKRARAFRASEISMRDMPSAPCWTVPHAQGSPQVLMG